jgi:anion-transporting  ArsA/GET3 family ATPase
VASKPFYTVADRILGSQFLQDIAEFFLLFQTMYDGFVERARAVTRTLSEPRTAFVVVSTLEAAPAREADFFVEALHDRGFPLGAVVVNKALPGWFLDRGATAAATELRTEAKHVADAVAAAVPDVGDAAQLTRVLGEVGESFLNFQVVAKREAEQHNTLASHAGVVATVPYADHDITDLAGLLGLGEALWR